MSQRGTAPDPHALDRHLVIEHLPGDHRSLIGARKRNNQIQLRAGIDDPANAAQNSIHFSKSSKSIDVHGCKAGGLRQQILVCHFGNPRLLASRDHDTVVLLTQSDSTEGSQNLRNTLSCDDGASVPQLCTRACKVFNFEHVNTTATLSHIIDSEFVQATPHEAPTVGIRPHLPAPVGAVNSGVLHG